MSEPVSELPNIPSYQFDEEFEDVIPRSDWTDIRFVDDPIENGIINDLMRCAPRLRTLGHAHARLDANAKHLIAVELAPRIREMMQ